MIDKIIKAILNKLDPDELVDILGLTTEELVDILSVEIEVNAHKFEYLVDEEGDDDA